MLSWNGLVPKVVCLLLLVTFTVGLKCPNRVSLMSAPFCVRSVVSFYALDSEYTKQVIRQEDEIAKMNYTDLITCRNETSMDCKMAMRNLICMSRFLRCESTVNRLKPCKVFCEYVRLDCGEECGSKIQHLCETYGKQCNDGSSQEPEIHLFSLAIGGVYVLFACVIVVEFLLLLFTKKTHTKGRFMLVKRVFYVMLFLLLLGNCVHAY